MTDVMKVLEQVAAKLGVAVEYLWEILVRQKFAEGVTNLIIAGILLVAIVVMCCVTPGIVKHYSNKYKELREDRMKNGTGYHGSHKISSFEEDDARRTAQDVPWIVFFIVLFMLVIVIPVTIGGVQKLINPEYFAIKEIMDAIGGTIG